MKRLIIFAYALCLCPLISQSAAQEDPLSPVGPVKRNLSSSSSHSNPTSPLEKTTKSDKVFVFPDGGASEVRPVFTERTNLSGLDTEEPHQQPIPPLLAVGEPLVSPCLQPHMPTGTERSSVLAMDPAPNPARNPFKTPVGPLVVTHHQDTADTVNAAGVRVPRQRTGPTNGHMYFDGPFDDGKWPLKGTDDSSCTRPYWADFPGKGWRP